MNLLNCIVHTTLLGLTLGVPNLENQQRVNTQTILLASQKFPLTRPTTKTSTLSVEGEKTTVTLNLYQNRNFTTYFPVKDFLVETASSGEGQAVKFIANFGGEKNENAYIHVAFLNSLQKYSQVSKIVNSKNGLIASNKWRVVSRIKNTSYSWAKEKIVFSKGKNIVGNIYLGEQKGKAFYIITIFPAEYADGFSPRADLILRNLEVSS